MLQLCQALMFEPHHFSALAEFLLKRSLDNPFVVGHEFFWQLRSQLHVKTCFERYALLLEQFLMVCGEYREQVLREVRINDGLMKVANSIKLVDKEKRATELEKQLGSFKMDYHIVGDFCLTVDPRMHVKDFLKNCKILSSKKLPLLLKMENSQRDAPPITIIFKTGDDLRQDILTIQLIRIMDKIWLDAGFDFRMKPYKVKKKISKN